MNLFVAPDLFTGVSGKDFLWRGILILILGILIALVPYVTLAVATVAIGWMFAIAGVWVILGSVFHKERRFFWTLYGLLMGLWGILMITHPFGMDYILAWFIAAWFITGGVIAIWDAAQSTEPPKTKILPVVSGLIALFIGYVFFVLPLTSLAGMIWLGGLLLILKGIMMISLSRIMAKHEKSDRH